MNTVGTPRPWRVRFAGAWFGLLWLVACGTPPRHLVHHPIRPELPPTVSINPGAGRGDLLFLTLRTEDQAKLLFIVDTGSPLTLMDSSLDSKLGKRLGTQRIRSHYGTTRGSVFAAPKLYLGDIRLRTDRRVVTVDMGRCLPYPGRPVMGILGMDCLKHYCLQLDFTTNTLRFLDPDRLAKADLGQAFPLHSFHFSDCATFRWTTLGGWRLNLSIDTGDNTDGVLNAGLIGRALRRHSAVSTNGMVRFGRIDFGDARYTNVTVSVSTSLGIWFPRATAGLAFLARHRVTLDFPRRTIYLRQTSVGPLEVKEHGPHSPGVTLGWWTPIDSKATSLNVESIAERLLSAPNLHPGDPLSGLIWWVHHNRDFRPLRIPVGPPPARLGALHLPPADYHMTLVAETNREAGQRRLSVSLAPQGTAPTVSLSPHGTVVLLHGYNGQKEDMSFWAYLLAQAGYRTILLDLRGHGESTGQDFTYGQYETADLRQVLDYLTAQRLCDGTVGVLGVGFGANVGLQWAARDSRVSAVVAIAPYDQPEPTFERIARATQAPIPPAALRLALDRVASRLKLDWADWSGAAAVRRLRQPVLFVEGGKDIIAPASDIDALARVAPPGSRNLLVRDADHRAVNHWFPELREPVLAWFQSHLPRSRAEPVDRFRTPSAHTR